MLKAVPTKAESVINILKKMEKVRKSYFSYGRFDIVAFLVVEDYKEIKRITGFINNLKGVRSTETLVEA